MTVPKYLTAAGMVDTMSHVMEGYFENDNVHQKLQDRLDEAVMCNVIENEGIFDDMENIELRGNLSWVAAVALIGVPEAGRGLEKRNFYNAHMLEHALGEHTDCTHGAGLAIMHPAWLYYLNTIRPEKTVQFAERVMKLERGTMTDQEYGKAGIDALRAKFRSWGMPITLKELGVGKEIIDKVIMSIERNPETDKNLLTPENVRKVLENVYEDQ